jgi:hypothetical protein
VPGAQILKGNVVIVVTVCPNAVAASIIAAPVRVIIIFCSIAGFLSMPDDIGRIMRHFSA